VQSGGKSDFESELTAGLPAPTCFTAFSSQAAYVFFPALFCSIDINFCPNGKLLSSACNILLPDMPEPCATKLTEAASAKQQEKVSPYLLCSTRLPEQSSS